MLTLKREEVVVERPFTHPDHIFVDRAQICLLINDLCRQLEAVPLSKTNTSVRYFPHETDWQKRLIIPNPSRFYEPCPLTIVGFMGRKRLNIPAALSQEINAIGQSLIANFSHFPAVLAYHTQLLVDELNYANLVVLDNEEAIQKWRDFTPHPYATDVFSPKFYDYVRIYNGRLPSGGLLNPHLLQLHRVKYWDYREQPTWHAIRPLTV
ncbi:MAG: hypothetical protein AAF614_28815 [Chloroflexota bacterium]